MIAAALRRIAWSVLLARGGAWCERDYAELLDDVGAAGRAQPDPASWFRDVVRLAMLDFLDFGDGDGGADGCLALADPWARRAWSQNSALYQLYERWRNREAALTMADFIVAAANGAMRNASAGARDPPFRFGRRDAMFCPDAADRLPASGTCGELRRVFVDQLGLTWTDAAALLGGSASAAGAEDFWDELLRSPETVAPPDPNATAPFGFSAESLLALYYDAGAIAEPCCATTRGACGDLERCAVGNACDATGAAVRAVEAFDIDPAVLRLRRGADGRADGRAAREGSAGRGRAAPASRGALLLWFVVVGCLAAVGAAAYRRRAAFALPKAWPALPALPKLPSRDANRRRVELASPASAVDDDDDDEAPANPFSNAAPAAPPRATIAVAGSFVDFDEEERKLIGL
ncbi:hypothetical protein JL721_9756 [Aureococcus anophagefferens]|nr:hypothetical protein JL721_9756 [Aureococcus anophagefferens]